MGFQKLRELLVGELADLVSAEDVRCATTVPASRATSEQESVVKVLDRRHDSVARPVYHEEQIDERSSHQDAHDLHRLYVIETDDRQIAQPVGIAPISRMLTRIIPE